MHLELARQLDLPVIIHDRDAHNDVLKILREDGKGTRGVMHSFSGDLDMMRECIPARLHDLPLRASDFSQGRRQAHYCPRGAARMAACRDRLPLLDA